MIDEKTKKRSSALITTLLCGNVTIGGCVGCFPPPLPPPRCNHSKTDGFHKPMLTRYIEYLTKMLGNREPSENAANYQRASGADAGAEYYRLLRQHHAVKAVLKFHADAINARIIPHPMTEPAIEVITRVLGKGSCGD